MTTPAEPLEHHPDCTLTGDSCLICDACAWEVSQLFDWPTDAALRVRERLDDALMECALHDYIQALSGPVPDFMTRAFYPGLALAGYSGAPVALGRYRARQSPDGWIWLEIRNDGAR